MLPDPYPVLPWTAQCRGAVSLPGSKSLTNRALLLAALCDGPVRLTAALFSRDTRILHEGLTALGFMVEADASARTFRVEGQGGRIPNNSARLFVGNAGTAARFLTAFVCLHPKGHYHFDGDEEMRRRPMGGLIEALQALGASFTFHGAPGCFPFEVHTRGLRGGDWRVDAGASSQMLSALMMVAPLAAADVNLSASGARPAFVAMTAGLMRQFDAGIEGSAAGGFRIPGRQRYRLPGGDFAIEPDATAASYFLALPAVAGGELLVRGLRRGMLQGDIAFAGVLQSLGLRIEETPDGWLARGPLRAPREPQTFHFEEFSDTFLTLAAIAPLLPCPVRITGLAHTRHQESDRPAAVAAELCRLGASVAEEPDAIAVQPFPAGLQPPRPPVAVRTYRDHRVAMAFAVLGSSPRFGPAPWLLVADPACCAKTFPAFFDTLAELYRLSHDT